MNSAGSCEHHNKPWGCLKGLAVRVTVNFSTTVFPGVKWGLDLISIEWDKSM
jgi:hypothetical protein